MNEPMAVIPIPDFPDFERVADYFFEDFRLRPVCLAYNPLALGHDMLAVRAAMGNRRPRYHQVPIDVATTIPRTGFYEENVTMIPGTIIWGLGVAISPEDQDGDDSLTNYFARITDLQTGVQIMSEFLSLRALSLADALLSSGQPHVLSQPHIVVPPGEILVEIGARDNTSSNVNFQLILFCSEPARVCAPHTQLGGRGVA